MSAPALNPVDAKCCCECRHWRRTGPQRGECRNIDCRWGMEYERADGSRYEVEYFTTGQYATCTKWQKKVDA